MSGGRRGGLLTAWLAANRPELVRSVVLEDPPLFSAEYHPMLFTSPRPNSTYGFSKNPS